MLFLGSKVPLHVPLLRTAPIVRRTALTALRTLSHVRVTYSALVPSSSSLDRRNRSRAFPSTDPVTEMVDGLVLGATPVVVVSNPFLTLLPKCVGLYWDQAA